MKKNLDELPNEYFEASRTIIKEITKTKSPKHPKFLLPDVLILLLNLIYLKA